MINVMLKFT